ncbi:hypothetical protein PHPALM_31984 [Phytophthora palmivora]|uniref:Uncharacterized protein n=1 Tax=Phytophthora palmivora TaxID=4796 RepID=A0A2P4X187_9STRA|nr:hypothetical protein PHPALM_31984 [Phytophthora palmivora]
MHDRWNRIVKAWYAIQLAPYGGKYSIERMLALEEYTRKTFLFRVVLTALTPPALIIVVVLWQESIPLQSPMFRCCNDGDRSDLGVPSPILHLRQRFLLVVLIIRFLRIVVGSHFFRERFSRLQDLRQLNKVGMLIITKSTFARIFSTQRRHDTRTSRVDRRLFDALYLATFMPTLSLISVAGLLSFDFFNND